MSSSALAALFVVLSGAAAGALTPPAQSSENRTPAFTEGSSTTRFLAENTAVETEIEQPVGATDADAHRLTYALGGDDAESFALDARTGQLRSRESADYHYEAQDRYTVTIRAEDGHGGSATIAVAVELTDESEPPSAPSKPTIAASTRNSLTATWTAPVNTGPEIRDYDGRFRIVGGGGFEPGWSRVSAVTEVTISELVGDTLYEVQVLARKAEGISGWSESVEARTEKNQVPVFSEGATPTRQLEENTLADMNVGAPLMATDADDDRLVYSLDKPDESAFSIDPSSGQLKTRAGASYDYETESEHEVTVNVDDGFGGAATSVVTVSLLDVDEPNTKVDAGWDLTVAAGGTAWLHGTASTTVEGEFSYSWSFVSYAGDTAPPLDDAATSSASFVAAAEGSYVVRLTVSVGTETASDDVLVVARASTEADLLVAADLLVDTNRDGVVDSADEDGEETWDRASGAVFGANADDDDEDGVRDGWDNEANGDADLLDMAPVLVSQIPGLHWKHTVLFEMTYTSGSHGLKLFRELAEGGIELLIKNGAVQAELPVTELVAGDLQLYVESGLGRDIGFDGQLTLTVTVREGETDVSQDSVALRGSPVLYSDHLQPADRVFVMEIEDSYYETTALVDALERHLPATVDLYRVRADTYANDRWIQDSMQTGYVGKPSTGGAEAARVHTQMHRPRVLGRFLPDGYLGPGAGYAKPADSNSRRTSFNYGGNVEVIPAYSTDSVTFPFGRIVIGGDPMGGSSAMIQKQIDFFNAQEVQGPVIVVDTAWLSVAHVDEIFSVLPNKNPEDDERSWVIAIGSTELAIELLEKAVADGYGDVAIMEGRAYATTASLLLADSDLMAVNDTAQAKIDSVREQLIADVGLEDADFREIPALFEEDPPRCSMACSMSKHMPTRLPATRSSLGRTSSLWSGPPWMGPRTSVRTGGDWSCPKRS